jgi:hypothetical protein
MVMVALWKVRAWSWLAGVQAFWHRQRSLLEPRLVSLTASTDCMKATLRHHVQRIETWSGTKAFPAASTVKQLPNQHLMALAGRTRSGLSTAAGALGHIMAFGLRSPLLRLTSRATLKISAAGLGLVMAAGFVPFALDVAGGAAETSIETGKPLTSEREAQFRREVSAGFAAQIEPFVTGSTAQWNRIAKPIAIFGLPAPDLASLPQRYESWRHGHGGRDDRLIFGEFDARPTDNAGPASHLHLSMLRKMPDAARARPFYIDLVRQASELRLSVEKTQQPTLIQTKFGPVEAADAVLTSGDQQRACLAFRFSHDATGLRMGGWWCAAGGRPADRQQLACVIDRLDLLSAGEDRELRALFSAADKVRDQGCTRSRIATTGRKVSWLDADGASPPLRGNGASPARL